jgi:hypothetical protein
MLKPLTYTLAAIAALTGALALAPGAAFGAQVIQLLSGSGATTPAFELGTSADGSRVFFETAENVPGTGDTDDLSDIYQAQGGAITLLTGSNPAGSGGTEPGLAGTSADGTRVLFETDENNVGAATDADGATDVYQAKDGVITLLTGNGAATPAEFSGASADGTRVFFETDENNVGGATDADGATDVYQAKDGVVTLLTGNGVNTSAFYDGASADGTRVFFETPENNVGGATDTDAATDIYQATGGAITLLTGNGAATPAVFDRVSADGTRLLFHTPENNVGGATDADGANDIYQAIGGTITLLTVNTAADSGGFQGASADATKVFFVTDENIAGTGDTDGLSDIYRAEGGVITLLTGSNPAGSGGVPVSSANPSDDGTRLFFDTDEDNVGGATDTDGAQDVYESQGGTITLLSGNGAADTAYFSGASADGTRVFFSTIENNVGGTTDTDGALDVYQVKGGAFTLLSGNGATLDASFGDASADGTRVFFNTPENIAGSGDTDNADDVYLSRAATSSSKPPPVTTSPTTTPTPTATPTATATGLRAKALKKCKKKPKGPKRHKCIKKAKKLPV